MAKEKKPSLNGAISGAIKGQFNLDNFKKKKNLNFKVSTMLVYDFP
jgi:hypothetical protein